MKSPLAAFLVGLGLCTTASAQVTQRVSVASDGAEGNNNSGYYFISMTPDGRYVVFPSAASNLVSGDSNGVTDIFIRDRRDGMTDRVSIDSAGMQGNGESLMPCVSESGRYVAFESQAGNLVLGDNNQSWTCSSEIVGWG
jgi:Tol biopolymer transport system component